MSKPVVTISAEETVQSAIDLMNEFNISSLIVFAGRSRPPGIITKRDYVTRVRQRIGRLGTVGTCLDFSL